MSNILIKLYIYLVVVINERSVQTLMETIPNLLLRYNLLDKTKKKKLEKILVFTTAI